MVIARGKRLVPFRTQKLRLFAPMVLHFCGCGRVGHRRFIFEKDPVSKDAGSFVIFAEIVVFAVVVSADVMRRNRCEYLAKLMCCVDRGYRFNPS